MVYIKKYLIKKIWLLVYILQSLKTSLIIELSIVNLLIPTNVFAIDLKAENVGESMCVLNWTAVGDDNMVGQAAVYDLRISNEPITESNFYSSIRVLNTPTPSVAGTKEYFLITLNAGEYYVCIKVGDEVPNWSTISNVLKLVVGVLPPNSILWDQ